MRNPELDQQVVEVMPLLTNRFRGRVGEGPSIELQGDPLKVLGFNGLERSGDPLHIWPPES